MPSADGEISPSKKIDMDKGLKSLHSVEHHEDVMVSTFHDKSRIPRSIFRVQWWSVARKWLTTGKYLGQPDSNHGA
jgi:hypothetical protein